MNHRIIRLLALVTLIGWCIPSKAQILNSIGRKLEKKANEIIHKKPNSSKDIPPQVNNTSSSSVQNNPFPTHVMKSNDFRSGQMIFSDDFTSEALGSMAKQWTSNGTGSVTEINGFAGRWLKLFDQNTYKIKNSNGLPSNFTIELDVVVLDDGQKKIALDFGFDYKKAANEHYYLADRNPLNIEASYQFDSFNFTSNELSSKKQSSLKSNMAYFINDMMRLKISVFGEQMKVYVNDYKILDTEMSNPNSKKYFYIATENEKNAAQIYISNVKITDLGQ
ncbi:MAG TPA: hypothetical protein VIG94_06925 [Faecalibacter sp.]